MDYDKVFVMTRVFFFLVFAGRGFGLRTKMCDDKEENSGTQVSSPASRSTKQSGSLRVFLTWLWTAYFTGSTHTRSHFLRMKQYAYYSIVPQTTQLIALPRISHVSPSARKRWMKRADWAGINGKDLKQTKKCRTNCVLGDQVQSPLNTPVCHFKAKYYRPM